MHYIEFDINGREYSASQCSFVRGYCWSNDLGEEGNVKPTLAEAQQDAINWESGRRDRYEGSEAQERDARNRYLNQRIDDAKEEP